MHRFFVAPETIQGQVCELAGDHARQISRVLRLRPGERVELLDDTGWAFVTELEHIAPASVRGRIINRHQPTTEPRCALALYQALPKHQKFDWVLQKGTELGVSTFVPLITSRSNVRANARSDRTKALRWDRIVTEASEQSGRTRRPRVLPVMTFEQACSTLPDDALGIMPYMDATKSLSEVLRTDAHDTRVPVRLLIGPEGGFTAQEAAIAENSGHALVSLGPRTLRSETAAIAAATIILHVLDQIG